MISIVRNLSRSQSALDHNRSALSETRIKRKYKLKLQTFVQILCYTKKCYKTVSKPPFHGIMPEAETHKDFTVLLHF